jgi:hypothetical protein
VGPAAERAASRLDQQCHDVYWRLLRIDSTGTAMVTTSVSTYDYAGENPSHYQQQIVARVPIP